MVSSRPDVMNKDINIGNVIIFILVRSRQTGDVAE